MANIDASIPLQAQAPQPIDFTKFAQLKNLSTQNDLMNQQISASQTGQELTRAQTANQTAMNPGLAAQSSSAQTKAQQDAIALKIQQATIEANKAATTTNPDGSKSYNPQKAAQILNAQGFSDAGWALLKTAAETTTAQAKSSQDQTKATSDLKAIGDSFATASASMLDTIKDPVQREQHAAALGKQIQSNPTLLESVGSSPLMTLLVADPSLAGAIKAGSITPEKAQQLAIDTINAKTGQANAASTAESVKQAGMTSLTGPEARSPTTDFSKSYVQSAIDQKIPGVKPGMSAYEASQLVAAKGAALAIPVSGEVKAGFIVKASQAEQAAKVYDAGAAAARKFNIPAGTNLSTWIEANSARFQNDPDFNNLNAAVAAADPTGSMPLTMGSKGIDTILSNKSALERSNRDMFLKGSKAKTFDEFASSVGAEGAPPQPGAPTKAPVPMKVISPTGKVRTIDASTWDAAKAEGYKQVK